MVQEALLRDAHGSTSFLQSYSSHVSDENNIPLKPVLYNGSEGLRVFMAAVLILALVLSFAGYRFFRWIALLLGGTLGLVTGYYLTLTVTGAQWALYTAAAVLAFAVGYTLYTMMLLATFALGASCGALTTLCIIWSKGMVESTAANTTAVVLSSAVLGLLTVRFQRCMVIYLTAVLGGIGVGFASLGVESKEFILPTWPSQSYTHKVVFLVVASVVAFLGNLVQVMLTAPARDLDDSDVDEDEDDYLGPLPVTNNSFAPSRQSSYLESPATEQRRLLPARHSSRSLHRQYSPASSGGQSPTPTPREPSAPPLPPDRHV